MRSHSNNLNQNSGSQEVSSVQESSIYENHDNEVNGERLIRPRVLVSEISNNNVEEDEPISRVKKQVS